MREFDAEADSFPYWRVAEFIDDAEWDASRAVTRLLTDTEYRRIERNSRGDVWASILYALRSTADDEQVGSVVAALREHLDTSLLYELGLSK